MPKRVEAWATDDGTVFDKEQDARAHEARTRLAEVWRTTDEIPIGAKAFADWFVTNAPALIHALRPLDTPETISITLSAPAGA